MRWLRLFFRLNFQAMAIFLLTEHRKKYETIFFVFNLIVIKVENLCSHSRVDGNIRS